MRSVGIFVDSLTTGDVKHKKLKVGNERKNCKVCLFMILCNA
jgi:hypothetical protein